ncbi:hypothetical protein KIN20_009464 [Parelaphostrongylus tenuis]|uniref:Uncharacterized protein n=1 Tax=Parelaphostrongylus tenuis TaxID=148309 RepID=A0AAD5MXT5_PARTN|nr:hypothetical protein KIN20_009464 [Parelaphostrongylus tenuis]
MTDGPKSANMTRVISNGTLFVIKCTHRNERQDMSQMRRKWRGVDETPFMRMLVLVRSLSSDSMNQHGHLIHRILLI